MEPSKPLIKPIESEVSPPLIIHAKPEPVKLKEVVINFADEEDPYLVIVAARNEKTRSNNTRKTMKESYES